MKPILFVTVLLLFVMAPSLLGQESEKKPPAQPLMNDSIVKLVTATATFYLALKPPAFAA